jgi:DNA-nicking Smr family endonuclease
MRAPGGTGAGGTDGNAMSDDDEKALFRAAVQDAKPLRPHGRIPPAQPRRSPQARFARAERAAVLAESLAAPGPFIATQPLDELQYRRDGVALTVLQKLRRGEYRIEDELDLHGCTGREAHTQLVAFLGTARARGLRFVRVIHGKGMRSGPGGPILKQTVNTLLRRADPVLAFTSARPRDGGTGATLVLLSTR